MKTHNAEKIGAWLKGRAAGNNGARLADELGIPLAKSTLAHLEWTALTYAGHTVWNMHKGKEDAGEGRRRPRSDWIVQRDTHPALISNDEAEAILARLESKKAGRATRVRSSDYLLSGLLVTPEGNAWHGNSGYYRVGSSNIKASALEASFLEQIALDIQSPAFSAQLVDNARRAQMPSDGAELAGLARQVKEIDGALARLLALIEQTDTPAPILRRIEARESERAELSIRLERLEEVTRQAKALAAVKEADAQRLLAALVEDMALLDRDHLKDFLRGLVEALILDPENRTGSIRYRIAASGVKVASPRGLVPNPSLSGSMPFQAPRNRRTA